MLMLERLQFETHCECARRVCITFMELKILYLVLISECSTHQNIDAMNLRDNKVIEPKEKKMPTICELDHPRCRLHRGAELKPSSKR